LVIPGASEAHSFFGKLGTEALKIWIVEPAESDYVYCHERPIKVRLRSRSRFQNSSEHENIESKMRLEVRVRNI
jgi:hypothetical protein